MSDAGPGPTREQIMSAMIAAIYEDEDEALVRQGMPTTEWNLLSIAADAVVGLLSVDREALRGKLDQMWGWAKSGETTDSEGGEYFLMDKENVATFTKDVLALIGGSRDQQA